MLMETFPIIGADEKSKVGFEIDNAYASSRELVRIVRGFEGVSAVVWVGSWLSKGDIRLRFSYRGEQFLVVEPYGDSSRYFIRQEHGKWGDNSESLESEFKAHKIGPLRKFIGDILCLRISKT
ncbi:MAG: hypothetical protein Q8N51_09860 [Gammaproteobacteria bacterium]|nr:hypothetical protein [Gammaproteobacteria bacterium]